MPGKHHPTHEDRENAEELARWSFERLEQGDDESARALADKAKRIDPDTTRKVFEEELGEDPAAQRKRSKPKRRR